MKGIILISHGRMAEGMADTARLFFGDEIPQLDYLCLEEGASPDVFREQLEAKINALDDGDGVIVMADLYGGTPCNQAVNFLGDRLELLAGMNFGMLMQALLDRDGGEVDILTVLETGRTGMVDVKAALSKETQEEDFL